MPTEPTHHLAGPLGVAGALAFAAGFVDAFVYQNVIPVFVANMSGNLIRFGIAAGTSSGSTMVNVGVALAAFLAGTVAGSSAVDRQVRRDRPPHARQLLVAEAALVGVVALLAVTRHPRHTSTPTGASLAIVSVAAIAMGMQAVSIRRVGQIAISTTHGTGALVRLGEKAALGVRRAERAHDVRRRRSIGVIAAVLVAYVAGSAAAAAMADNATVLLIPLALIAGSAVATRPSEADLR